MTACLPRAAIPSKNMVPDNQNWSPRKIELIRSAADCADYCKNLFEFESIGQRESVEPFVVSKRILMPESSIGWLPERLRLESADWWNNQLSKRNVREGEQKRIAAHRVTKYCSDELVTEFRDRKERLKKWIECSYLEDTKSGDVVDLASIVAGSVANPRLRRNELMVRIRGMEELSIAAGHVCRFITITAPSSFHSNSFSKYNGLSPRDVQAYMVKTWARVRSMLKRQSISVYGLRIAEPHKDGCPHWHMVLFFESGKQAKIGVKTIRDYFLSVDGDEVGAQKNRVKTIAINTKNGSVVGYVAKYVCKNVDGSHVDVMTDRDGVAVTDGSDGAERVRAWASCWGVRQFQFLGGAPVGVWRQLRRVRDASKIPKEMLKLWSAADSADYAAFMAEYRLLDVVGVLRHGFADDMRVLVEKYGTADKVPDDAILSLKTLNKYQEPKSEVIGVFVGNVELRTRQLGEWLIKTIAPSQTVASVFERTQSYAIVRAGTEGESVDGRFWDDVFEFGALCVPQGTRTSDLWQ